MKAIKYNVKVYGSVLDFAHGHSTTVTEIFIPELKISINFHGNTLRIFKTEEERYENAQKLGGLELDEKSIQLVTNYLNLSKECENHFKKYFKNI